MRRPPVLRWSLAALLSAASVAAVLALVPVRADALEAGAQCSATGYLLCYRIELGTSPETGLPEVRAYAPLFPGGTRTK